MATETKLHGLFRFVAVVGLAAVGARAAAACNDTALIEPPDCHPDHCTCEQDPVQLSCTGFNDRPESGPPNRSDASDADASEPDASDSGDAAPSDAPDDGGDEAG